MLTLMKGDKVVEGLKILSQLCLFLITWDIDIKVPYIT